MEAKLLLVTMVVLSFLVPAGAMSDYDINLLKDGSKLLLTSGDAGEAIQYCDISLDQNNDLHITVLPATGYNDEDTQLNIIKTIGAIGGVYVYSVNEWPELGDLYITFGNEYKTTGKAYALRSWAKAVDTDLESDYETLGLKIFGTLTTNS